MAWQKSILLESLEKLLVEPKIQIKMFETTDRKGGDRRFWIPEIDHPKTKKKIQAKAQHPISLIHSVQNLSKSL